MIAGWISATIVLSRAKRKVDDRTATTAKPHLRPCISRGDACTSGGGGAFSSTIDACPLDSSGVCPCSRKVFSESFTMFVAPLTSLMSSLAGGTKPVVGGIAAVMLD